MLQPFTGKDFTIRSIADRILDLKYLMYLFPHIPKDEAFSKYYTLDEPNAASSNGYVKPNLVTQVPGYAKYSFAAFYYIARNEKELSLADVALPTRNLNYFWFESD